ncbi:MAG: hypothetical protein HZY75_09725 [Nocardioidaceae bacterium]|nr:MAG: hypothetical protein HZY75_09725 [Nocardioidaceae bacterium]
MQVVAEQVTVPWAATGFAVVIASVSLSASESLASTSMTTGTAVVALAVSSLATGEVFGTSETVIVTVAVSEPPLPSLIV